MKRPTEKTDLIIRLVEVFVLMVILSLYDMYCISWLLVLAICV